MNDRPFFSLPLIPAKPVPRLTCQKQALRFGFVATMSFLGILAIGLLESPGDIAIAAEPASVQEKKAERRKSDGEQQQGIEQKKKQERTSDQAAPAKKPDDAQGKETSRPEESLALEFARTHHPELATLLVQLQKSNPREYRAALTELERTRIRLERDRERFPERYALELEKWKLDSRVRLLVARMSMSESDDLKAELRTALQDRLKISEQLLKDEQERLQRRLAKIEEQLASHSSNREKTVDQEMNSLLSSANKAASKRKAAFRKIDGTVNAKTSDGKSDKSAQPKKTSPGK